MNNKLILRFVCALTLLSLVSCVTPGNPAVRQARGQFQSRRTVMQGTIGGALLGAAIGAGIGALQGDGNAIVKGAIIGGGLGAFAGNAYGRNVADQRHMYAAREGALDNAIANASTTRKAAADFNRVLASQLRNARSNNSESAGTVADARAVLSSVNREINRQQGALNSAKTAGLSPSSRQRLQAEISGLESEKRQLQSNIDKLAPPTSPSGLAGSR